MYFRARPTAARDRPRAHQWEEADFLWTKVFAPSFAIGVVAGITMSMQFGTNRPGYMEKAGNIAGPLLGYEVLTAYFLEATFLGIMLFGRNRVSDCVHLVATRMVAAGTTLSAFWILSPRQAAAAHESLVVIFLGVAITLPAIIVYPVFMYRAFRGRASTLGYGLADGA